MFFYSIVLLLLVQQIYSLDISVNMNVANTDYTLKFPIESTNIVNLSQKFCVEQATKLGITDATFNNCVQSVNTYVQNYVNKFIIDNNININDLNKNVNNNNVVESKTSQLTPLVVSIFI